MQGPVSSKYSHDCPVSGKQHTYEVESKTVVISLVQPSTGLKQKANMLVRDPKGCTGKHPGVVFMHGAGYGTAENSFGDVATALASAGFITATVDKPVWNTSDITRDYKGSASAYEQVVDYLRSRSDVVSDEVGIYATSESAWISPYMIAKDKNIAFQILLSPMLMSPRITLGFFVAQDFSIVGAHAGYQNLVSTICSWNLDAFGLHNIDQSPQNAQTYTIPTFLAYGSKDVMTAQVEGTYDILTKAKADGNKDLTIRNYPLANHVLRLGDEANPNTQLADHYIDDMVAWASGVANGQTETSPRVAGATIKQSIAVPSNFHSSNLETAVSAILIVLLIVFLLLAIVMSIAALFVAIVRKARYRRYVKDSDNDDDSGGPDDERKALLGFRPGFASRLVGMGLLGVGGLIVYGAAIGLIVWGLVKLVWGAAPEAAGYIDWSWYLVQGACVLTVLMLSQFISRIIEAKHSSRLRRGKVKHMIATTKFSRFYAFVIITLTVVILLLLGSWGVFLA
jgi:hypothetical protein